MNNTHYIVIELQDSGENLAVLTWTFNNRNDAEAKYHSLLAICAVSAVPIHGAALLDGLGNSIESRSYTHVIAKEN